MFGSISILRGWHQIGTVSITVWLKHGRQELSSRSMIKSSREEEKKLKIINILGITSIYWPSRHQMGFYRPLSYLPHRTG